MRPFFPLAAVAALVSLSLAPTAHATPTPATGAAPSTTPDATAPATRSGVSRRGLLTRPLQLTRTQTRRVQRRLGVKPSGRLGTHTRDALRHVQRQQSLKVNGRPTIETLRRLGLNLADQLERQLREQESAIATTVGTARSFTGLHYVWGGSTPSGFDCSGLTKWAFAKGGIRLPRTSQEQFHQGSPIARQAIERGDLVFFDSGGPGASHVGIATAATLVISATGHGVMEHSISNGYWASHYVGARRIR